MAVFLHSLDNAPLTTTEQIYDAYVKLGKLLFEALAPTAEEIKVINHVKWPFRFTEETLNADIGFLACLVFEERQAKQEEAESQQQQSHW